MLAKKFTMGLVEWCPPESTVFFGKHASKMIRTVIFSNLFFSSHFLDSVEFVPLFGSFVDNAKVLIYQIVWKEMQQKLFPIFKYKSNKRLNSFWNWNVGVNLKRYFTISKCIAPINWKPNSQNKSELFSISFDLHPNAKWMKKL